MGPIARSLSVVVPVLGLVALASSEGIESLFPLRPAYHPVADWVHAYWWLAILAIMLLHQLLLVLHAALNRSHTASLRAIWSIANLLAWPVAPIIYALFGANRSVRTQ